MPGSARFDFQDAVVLVTGASSGIGFAIASAFVEAGASVVVNGRDQVGVEAAVAKLGDRATAAVADVASRGEVRDMVGAVIERHDRLDVVVANAGVMAKGDVSDLSERDWDRVRSVILDGFFFLAQATLPKLVRTQGSLIAVTSVSGLRGDWGQSAYNAAKAGVTNFVRSLALDYGGRGVRVNAVAPSLTQTPLTQAATDDDATVGAALDRVALGRLGRPEDVAAPVLFLASDAARYLTGVVLPVDGGTTASTGQAHLGQAPNRASAPEPASSLDAPASAHGSRRER